VSSPNRGNGYSVSLSKKEIRASEPYADTLNSAVEIFERCGFLLIKKALSTDLVRRLQKAYLSRYIGEDRSEFKQGCFPVGHKRFMIGVEIAPPFDRSELYANPFVYPILVQLLGPALVLNSLGSVCAFPGSEAQHVHLDHPLLFEEGNVSEHLPPYAITLVVPLVDIDAAVGPTAVWKGSHREGYPRSCPTRRALMPKPRMGDVLLMDYRLLHGGRANSSTQPRPILYLVYSRPWFRDAVNFANHPPISLSSEVFARLADAHKPLFRYHQVR
jgi:hypothetical protein